MCHTHLAHPLLSKTKMEEKPIIYTYGNFSIDAQDLIHIIQPYHINCIIDCRPQSYTMSMQNTPADKLQQMLKQNGIDYLPYYLHFGLFPIETRNSYGNILYSKVVKYSKFIEGIKLLNEEIEKGQTICIIDQERDIAKSIRYTIIGKFLKGKYNVNHILLNGSTATQDQVGEQLTEHKNIQKQKNSEAKKIGETGEELAALYLTKNGYQILDHNWNLHRGCELDLVAMKDNTLHFIEVKTRSSDLYGEPQAAINWVKMKHICNAIQQYRYRRGFINIAYQIDSIAILYRADNDYDLRHFLDIRPNGSACADVITYQQTPNL